MSQPLRIAYFSPLPPARSGIADYSAELLPHLAKRAEVTLFTDDLATATALGLPARTIADYPAARWDFDLALYQMGNSSHHEQIYTMLLRYPGVVVLHDLSLHHFIADRTAGHGDSAAYARELGYALGDEGRRMYDDIRFGKRPSPLAELPLNNRLVDTSLGLIVHSDFARQAVRQQRPGAPVALIPQLIAHRDGRSRRSERGLPEDTILFGSVGQVTLARQMPQVLRALRAVLDEGIAAHMITVGEVLPAVDLDNAIATLGLGQHVTQIGFVPDLQSLADWTATMDVVVNLRVPTMGETSASVLRAMDLGRPVIVNDHGWYSELPDEVVVKIAPESDAAELAAAMATLSRDKAQRDALGRAAAAYVAGVARPESVAEAYVDFLSTLREAWRNG